MSHGSCLGMTASEGQRICFSILTSGMIFSANGSASFAPRNFNYSLYKVLPLGVLINLCN